MPLKAGEEPSFDPRSWRGDGEAKDAHAPDDPSSYDPSTWSSKPSAAAPAPRPARSAPFNVARTAAIAGIVVVVTAGVVAARLSATQPHRARQATAVQVARAAPAAPASAGAERMASAVANLAALPQALVASGASSTDAQAAAQAIAGLLGPSASGLHLAAFLTPGPAGARLTRIEVRRDDGTGAAAQLVQGRFVGAALAQDLAASVKDVRGELNSDDFYSSAVTAGVPDTLIHDFAQAFTFDFDFERELKVGDVFEAVFAESVSPSGKVIGAPQLLFALLTTQSKAVGLYRFQPPGQQSASWFDANGRTAARGLMRTPVEGARVTSPFGLRMHPILGFMKMHNGVDFAAVTGTPIYASGDGTVEYSGPKGPDGNFVQIRHDNGWQTLYLHQNKIEPEVVVGGRVRQGQQIGEVGSTGVDSAGHSTVTGPHLHYEVHVNGQPVDPLGLPIETGTTLTGPSLQAFIKERNRIDALRAAQTG